MANNSRSYERIFAAFDAAGKSELTMNELNAAILGLTWSVRTPGIRQVLFRQNCARGCCRGSWSALRQTRRSILVAAGVEVFDRRIGPGRERCAGRGVGVALCWLSAVCGPGVIELGFFAQTTLAGDVGLVTYIIAGDRAGGFERCVARACRTEGGRDSRASARGHRSSSVSGDLRRRGSGCRSSC